jgi:hypothetical protein
LEAASIASAVGQTASQPTPWQAGSAAESATEVTPAGCSPDVKENPLYLLRQYFSGADDRQKK